MRDSGQKLEYQGVRVVVTGATGFIGRWVRRLLNGEGADLWVVARSEQGVNDFSKTNSLRTKVVIGDLSKPGVFERLLTEIQPDITFNLTGYGVSRFEKDESMAWKINAELVEEIALTISEQFESEWKGLRLVHVGSGFEYGSNRDEITEDTEPKPNTTYGMSKLTGTKNIQEICSATGLRAVTARLFTVYGPGENEERLLPTILKAAKMGGDIKLTKGEQERDFTYVKDVAIGLLKLGQVSDIPGNIVNLAMGKLTSVRDFVECARDLLDIEPSRFLFGSIPYREDEIRQGKVNVNFLRNCTDWLPSYSIYDGIKETIEFEKQILRQEV